MYQIAFIEPCHHLLYNEFMEYFQLNFFQVRRLTGIRDALDEYPEIKMVWMNTNIDTANFIRSGEFNEYDGVLLTAPDREVCRLIQDLPGSVPFLISEDADPGADLNYTGPDHYNDARRVVETLQKEGNLRICLVAAYDIPRTLSYLDAFTRIFKEKKLPFDETSIIGLDIKTRQSKLSALTLKERTFYITDRILENDGTQAFIFLDNTPIREILRELVLKHQIKIPGNFKMISMVGESYWPITNSKELTHALARVNQDYYNLGRESVHCLVDIMQGRRPPKGNKIMVPGEFVRRDSIIDAIILDEESKEYFKSSVARYIHRHYQENLSARSIANTLGLSYSYFLKKFKANFDCSLSDYISRIRVNKAAYLISQTTKSLTSIYTEVGFVNKNTFTNRFKKRFNQLPSTYRKKFT